MKNLLLIFASILFSATVFATSDVLDKAESGNLKALQQAFIMHSKSDGAEAEIIDISIGKSITGSPKNFLTALKRTRSKVKNLAPILANLGPDFVDKTQEQKGELEARLRAIQSVKEKSLKSVRSECELILKDRIAKLNVPPT